MNESPNQWGIPNTRMAELFNAMVGAYETWAEPLFGSTCTGHSEKDHSERWFFGNPARTEEQARAAQDALVQLTEFFAKTVAERRKHKGSDLISLLLDIEEEGEVLTEEEHHAQCIMLLFGGHETTQI